MADIALRPLMIARLITVRTYDVDFAHIVHNIVYLRWLEDLRSEILTDVLPIDVILASGVSPILTRTEIDYLWPVRIGDQVTGRMWVANLSRTRWTLAAEIGVGEQICAAARQSGYFADLKTLRPVRVPAQLQSRWQVAVTANANPQSLA